MYRIANEAFVSPLEDKLFCKLLMFDAANYLLPVTGVLDEIKLSNSFKFHRSKALETINLPNDTDFNLLDLRELVELDKYISAI